MPITSCVCAPHFVRLVNFLNERNSVDAFWLGGDWRARVCVMHVCLFPVFLCKSPRKFAYAKECKETGFSIRVCQMFFALLRCISLPDILYVLYMKNHVHAKSLERKIVHRCIRICIGDVFGSAHSKRVRVLFLWRRSCMNSLAPSSSYFKKIHLLSYSASCLFRSSLFRRRLSETSFVGYFLFCPVLR